MNNLSKLFRYVSDSGNEIIFDSDYGYLINKPNGIDTLALTLTETQGISQVGTTIVSRRIKSRPITISGIVIGDNYKEKLIKTFRPDEGGILYADEYYIPVVVKETPTISGRKRIANFQLSLVAPYPYWKGDESSYSITSGALKHFKFPWNISRAYRFGEYVEVLYQDVINKGYIESGYTMELVITSGALTAFQLLNMETLKQVTIERAMTSGEHITLECQNGSISAYSSMNGDVSGSIAIGSDLFTMDVGDNYIKPNATGTASIKCTITTNVELAGIAV